VVYTGLGVVALREENGEERGEPVAVALLQPLRPRELVLFERRGSRVYAYTAHPDFARVLREHGYRQLQPHVYAKLYSSEEEMGEDLARIKERLRDKYYFFLEDLDRLVKRHEKRVLRA
jgi:hypothetical protein